jgi:predicted aldo/keto reductase-like oxidoreductase
MKTDYIDILQLHNPRELPHPNDSDGAYGALLEMKKAGKVRHIGMSNHRLDVAIRAAESGLFETIQFPISIISADKDLELIRACRENDVGVIAMKAMAGGLIRNTRAAFAFFRQFDNVAAIWGVQRESELDEFISYEAEGVEFDGTMREAAARERGELGDDFCRGCGYCLPCSAHIPINNAARMSLLIRRAPQEAFLSERWRKEMMKIEDCIECDLCKDRCPYGLDTPALLKKNLEDYKTFLK